MGRMRQSMVLGLVKVNQPFTLAVATYLVVGGG